MTVFFASVEASKDVPDYIESKLRRSELAPEHRDWAREMGLSDRAAVPIAIPEAELPHLGRHHTAFITLRAELTLPVLDDEVVAEEVLGALAEEFLGIPAGTCFLRRRTNYSEHYVFFDGLLIRDRKLHRPEFGEDVEQALGGLDSVVTPADAPPLDGKDGRDGEADVAAVFAFGAIALFVAKAVIGGALSHLGSRAIKWALDELGIMDAEARNEEEYEKLAKLLEATQNAEALHVLRDYLNSALIKVDRYNAGSRDRALLDEAIDKLDDFVGRFHRELAGREAASVKATGMTVHLALLQERATWEKGAHHIAELMALSFTAGRYATIARTDAQSVIDYRMSWIDSTTRERTDFSQKVFWYDDKIRPNGRLIHAYWRQLPVIRPCDFDQERAYVEMNRYLYWNDIIIQMRAAVSHIVEAAELWDHLGSLGEPARILSRRNRPLYCVTKGGYVLWYRPDDELWEPLAEQVLAFSEGSDGAMWGVMKEVDEHGEPKHDGPVKEKTSANWVDRGRRAVLVSVGSASHVWISDKDQQIWRYTGGGDGQDWQEVSGPGETLSQLAVDPSGRAWGLGASLDNTGHAAVYVRSSDQEWRAVGRMSRISVGGAVFAMDSAGTIHQYTGHPERPWTVAGLGKALDISGDSERSYALIDLDGKIWRQTDGGRVKLASPMGSVITP